MKIIFSYKAVFGLGGQGLNFKHIYECFPNSFEKVVFSETPHIGFQVPVDLGAKFIGFIPFVRKLRDIISLREHVHFDHWVSKQIPDSDCLIAGAGYALETFRIAKKRKIRCVLDVTTNHVDQFGDIQIRETKKFGGRVTLHTRLRNRIREEYYIADRIRVMSAVSKKSLEEGGVDPNKIFVATPPIANPMAPSFDLTDDIFRVVFVGLLEPAKGFHYLLEAFKSIEGNCQLELYGGPGLRGVTNYLEKEMKSDPRIRIIPKSVQGCFKDVYCKASVFVLPSLSDGFGYVVGEAMSCGVPVIVTTNCGAADLIEDGVTGFVVPPADSQALARVLKICKETPQNRNKVGIAGRKKSSVHTHETFWHAWQSSIL